MTSPSTSSGPGSRTIFGRKIIQLGYSVEDIPAAVDFLVETLGAGPFFLMKDVRIPVLRNADGPIIWEHSAAFGQWGDVCIELQQVDRLEPADALGATYQRVGGVNHVAYIADDLAAERKRLEGMGLTLLFEAFNGPHESLLFDAPLLGHTIEVHQDFALFVEFRRIMEEAAANWDGSDRLRPVPRALQDTLARPDA